VKEEYINAYSFLFGLMCVGVVYLHSSWIGGFDIYYIGTKSTIIKKISSLLLMTIVPSFFILWGYLSGKYFVSRKSPLIFFKDKILQFYPPYFVSFLVYSFTHEKWVDIPIAKFLLGAIGVYYESGMGGGGNIYFVTFWVITTVSIFKSLSLRQNAVYLYSIICLLITKLLPHESSFCFIQYFGYYTAYFIGSTWYLAQDRLDKRIKWTICALGFATPILNFFGYKYTEIEYNPGSPEQLLFCFSLLLLCIKFTEYTKLYNIDSLFIRFINKVGNNAYLHFIIHTHVIYLIMLINNFLAIDKLYFQIFTVFFTSYISIYLLLPILKKITKTTQDFVNLC